MTEIMVSIQVGRKAIKVSYRIEVKFGAISSFQL